MRKLKNIMVTGGAGFIGSNFIRSLLKKADFRGLVVNVDNLTYAGNLENLKDVHAEFADKRYFFEKIDICDGANIRDILSKYEIDTIVHFAAESHVDRSILGATPFIKTNIEGTFTLLESAQKLWVDSDDKLFLHVSTDEVFGALDLTSPPFNENSPYKPNSPYSASKAASDHLARAWHRTYGLPVIISNCSNNYGPWQFPEKLIPLMILNAFEDKELPVYGDGLYVRDWIHVLDHCEALQAILEQGKIGETYAISGETERSNIHIVTTICDVVDRLMGRALGTSQKLMRYVADRPGHDRRYALDSSKLRKELFWKPRRLFENEISALVRWYHEHKKWTDDVRNLKYLEFYDKQYNRG